MIAQVPCFPIAAWRGGAWPLSVLAVVRGHGRPFPAGAGAPWRVGGLSGYLHSGSAASGTQRGAWGWTGVRMSEASAAPM
eukprot:15479545-Alexandrium_andersonii.AAC.1